MVFNRTFPIDLEANEIPYDAESVGKVYLQSKFGLDLSDSYTKLYVYI